MKKLFYTMKNGLFVLALTGMISLVSCGGDEGSSDTSGSGSDATETSSNNDSGSGSTGESAGTGSNSAFIDDFLEDVKSLESMDSKNQISEFTVNAMKSADGSKSFTNNIKDVLEEGASYKYIVITVSDHTIVLIDDLTNCKDSGSWGACMPYGKGYIKRGALNYQEDYINNIIGRADDQERMAFFFN